MKTCLTILSALVLVLAAVSGYYWNLLILSPIHFKPVDLTGRKAIVTGATNGIGVEITRKLVEWNCTVIIGVRDREKGKAVKREIIENLPRESTGRIDVYSLDLASFDSVREFSRHVLSKHDVIDMLYLNAGMLAASSDLALSEENGIEIVYQANHLSHFLLQRLLIPLLRKSPFGGRVIWTSSTLHLNGDLGLIESENESLFGFDSPYSSKKLNKGDDAHLTVMKSYADTKLMNVITSLTLNNLEATHTSSSSNGDSKKVTSYAVHPGVVMSNLQNNAKGLYGVFAKSSITKAIQKMFTRPTPDGAVTSVTVGTSPEIEGDVGGKYYDDNCIMNWCKVRTCFFSPPVDVVNGGVKNMDIVEDEKVQAWLWKTSEAIVGWNQKKSD